MIFKAGEAEIHLQQAGTFLFKNASNELMAILDGTLEQLYTLSDTLSTDTVNTMLGPMKLNAFETYENIASAVQNLKTMLETLKGS
jgi:hypothetical protein